MSVSPPRYSADLVKGNHSRTIFDCIRAHDLDGLRQWVVTEPRLVSVIDPATGLTPLLTAAMLSPSSLPPINNADGTTTTFGFEAVRLLVEEGAADPNQRSATAAGDTALHYAAANADFKMLYFLVRNGARPTIRNNISGGRAASPLGGVGASPVVVGGGKTPFETTKAVVPQTPMHETCAHFLQLCSQSGVPSVMRYSVDEAAWFGYPPQPDAANTDATKDLDGQKITDVSPSTFPLAPFLRSTFSGPAANPIPSVPLVPLRPSASALHAPSPLVSASDSCPSPVALVDHGRMTNYLAAIRLPPSLQLVHTTRYDAIFKGSLPYTFTKNGATYETPIVCYVSRRAMPRDVFVPTEAVSVGSEETAASPPSADSGGRYKATLLATEEGAAGASRDLVGPLYRCRVDMDNLGDLVINPKAVLTTVATAHNQGQQQPTASFVTNGYIDAVSGVIAVPLYEVAKSKSVVDYLVNCVAVRFSSIAPLIGKKAFVDIPQPKPAMFAAAAAMVPPVLPSEPSASAAAAINLLKHSAASCGVFYNGKALSFTLSPFLPVSSLNAVNGAGLLDSLTNGSARSYTGVITGFIPFFSTKNTNSHSGASYEKRDAFSQIFSGCNAAIPIRIEIDSSTILTKGPRVFCVFDKASIQSGGGSGSGRTPLVPNHPFVADHHTGELTCAVLQNWSQLIGTTASIGTGGGAVSSRSQRIFTDLFCELQAIFSCNPPIARS